MKKSLGILIILTLVMVPGCIGDQNGQISQQQKQNIVDLVRDISKELPKPTVNVPPNQTVDTTDLKLAMKEYIQVSADQTANQMTGFNSNINRIADKMTGVENNIGKLAEVNLKLAENINNTMNNTANTNATATATLNAVNDMKLVIATNVQVMNDLKAELKILMEIKLQLESLTANIQAVAGVGNDLHTITENMKAQAGRDVNFFPKNAVDVMLSQTRSNFYIVLIIVILGAFAMSLTFRASRDRERQRTKTAEGTTKLLFGLLMQCLSMLPEKQALAVTKQFSPDLHNLFKGGEDENKNT